MTMPPEKVAVLCITGVIAVLVAVTLLNSAPEGPGRDREADWSTETGDTSWEQQGVGSLDRASVVEGRARTVLRPPPVRSSTRTVSRARSDAGAKAGPTRRTWTVRSGDTLEDIARKVYGSRRFVSAILAANPGVDARRLQLRMVLRLPDARGQRPVVSNGARRASRTIGDSPANGRWYVVRSGDRLETIARNTYGKKTGWRRIWDANRKRMKSPNRLNVGQRLWLPAS